MPKVILVGSPQTQWQVNGRFLPGGTAIDVTEDDIKKHPDVISKRLDGPVIEIKEAKIEVKKKFTMEELFNMTKGEQVELLKKLGVEKIPKTEKDRVDLIVEIQ